MIPKECKRLIEVDFPIARVGAHAVKEKPIVRLHPQSFHQWWARRPLAACRAVLMALLLPDPADPHCPQPFKDTARRLLAGVEDEGPETDVELRKALLDFIAEFSDWDRSADKIYIDRAKALVKAAHREATPLVVDPFAGGGSIPLEALRLGCDAFASDLNPVACLILKVMLEDIPKHGPRLAEEFRKVGGEIKAAAEKELSEFYPPDPDGAKPIAYLWARTVRCESPNCGAEIPLARSFWLSKKASRRRALRWKIERSKKGAPQAMFEVFEPKEEREVPAGTVTRAKATCLACGTVLPPDRVRAQLAAHRGGADAVFNSKGARVGGARLLAVVTVKEGETGRRYRLPVETDYDAVRKAMTRLEKVAKERLRGGLSPVPDEPTPAGGGSGAGRAFSVQKYGMLQWGDLFTARQKLTLTTLAAFVARVESESTVRELSAFVLSRLTDRLASLMSWDVGGEKLGHVFNRQALPIVWDFAEGAPFADATGSYLNVFKQIEGATFALSQSIQSAGQVRLTDACQHPLPDASASCWFTDPPYYDAVPYSDLSDFFFVWLKRVLPDHPLLRDPFDPKNSLTPKTDEIVQDETKQFQGRPKDRSFFEGSMSRAFAEGRRVLREDGVGCVVFAHKTTEGWEALLSGMVRGGWVITASWPVATERPGRLRSQQSAALATSVHLVVRPRLGSAPVGGWEEILQELPIRMSTWVETLSKEGIRGADLVFSCIGPAMELFSRYPRVDTADGREVKLEEFLAKVWEVLGRTALQRVLSGEGKTGDATGALEEDARLTALFLWTLQSTAGSEDREAEGANEGYDEEVQMVPNGDEESPSKAKAQGGYALPYDIVRRFAQPLGIHLEDWEGRITETDKGVVRLLPVTERTSRLFGKEDAETVARAIHEDREKFFQTTLFPQERLGVAPELKPEAVPAKRKGRSKAAAVAREATTLDRLHAAMLLQRAGQTAALRVLLEEEIRRGPEFEHLANALSALYPTKGEEKRLIDAMLLSMPRR